MIMIELKQSVYIWPKFEIMHNFLLHFHSGLRWLILVVAIIAIVKSLTGLVRRSEYKKMDKMMAVSFVGMMHLQLVTGLVLYFFYSPFITYDMNDQTSRFWSVEHITLMLFAVIVAQIGRSLGKKTQNVRAKFRFQSIFFLVSFLLMLWGIPWDRI